MSALGQKQKCAVQNVMSALHPKADICSALAHVRFVPIADIRRTSCVSGALASAFKLSMSWPPKRRFQHPFFYAKLLGNLMLGGK